MLYQRKQLIEARKAAIDIFYSMKTLDLEIARIEDIVKDRAETDLMTKILDRRKQLAVMEVQYDQLLEKLGAIGAMMSEEDQLIYRVARYLGECELTMPEDFLAEVKTYMGKWRGTKRLP